jgi:hypothetical protein
MPTITKATINARHVPTAEHRTRAAQVLRHALVRLGLIKTAPYAPSVRPMAHQMRTARPSPIAICPAAPPAAIPVALSITPATAIT